VMEVTGRTLSGPVKLDNSIQINKWIRFALAAVVAILGGLIAWGQTYDWTQIVSKETAGTIVFLIGLLKTAYTAFAPSSGKGTAPTDGYIITQRGITKV
jgi:hypothetical protein